MFCARTKEFLSQKSVAYEDRDITQEPAALDELKRLGVMTTPVTVVDGAVIVGFDPDRLEQALHR